MTRFHTGLSRREILWSGDYLLVFSDYHSGQAEPIKEAPLSTPRKRDVEFMDVAAVKGSFAQSDFTDHPEIIHNQTKARRGKTPRVGVYIGRRSAHIVKEAVSRR
jgi:hypothetical protein